MRSGLPSEERIPWKWLLLGWCVLLVPASVVASLLWTDSLSDMTGALAIGALGWLGSVVVFRMLVPLSADALWAEKHLGVGFFVMLPALVGWLLASFMYMQ